MTEFRVTREDLRRYAPRANQHYADAIMSGMEQIRAAGITTPLRWCHFIAQWHHETGGFTIVREKCTWTAAQMCALWPHRFRMSDPIFRARYAACRGEEAAIAELAYGPKVRPDLGNSEEGDGYLYRGGSFCQGTGRNWYRAAGEALGLDLEENPDLIENPRNGLSAALWFWLKLKLNIFADANNGRAVGNGINRGNPNSSKEPIGYKDRQAAFDRAWAIWGGGSIETTSDLDVGSYGTDVLAVQLRLRELCYAAGSPDKAFGPETGRAVAAFKADWCRERGTPLEPGTVVGPLTKAALAEAEPIERPERAETTAAELRASGSTEMQAGAQMRAVGSATTAVGAVGAADQLGLLETVQASVGWLPAMQATAAPALDALRWGMSHLPFLAMILLGLLVYNRGYVIEQARLTAHRLGFNLGR